MRRRTDGLELSASDLASHLGCRHLTQLDLAVAEGTLAPPAWRDPTLAVLQERGLDLEKAYLAHLRARGLSDLGADPDDDSAGIARTIAAMRDGADVIYQAALRTGHWYGRADFLQRVDRPSRLGDWSYEVLDAKLARDTRAGTILQLCLYSHMLGEIQGVLPGADARHPTRRGLSAPELPRPRLPCLPPACAAAARDGGRTAPANLPPIRSPFPNATSAAGGRSAIDGATTMTISASWPASRGSRSTSSAAGASTRWRRWPNCRCPSNGGRHEERWRPMSACASRPEFSLRGGVPARPFTSCSRSWRAEGFCRLPEPSPGDIFLDFESDPFVGTCGLEYLLGWAIGAIRRGRVSQSMGLRSRRGEGGLRSLHRLGDGAAGSAFPDLHIYHFSPYEPAALKRLMGRYATREDELDRHAAGRSCSSIFTP